MKISLSKVPPHSSPQKISVSTSYVTPRTHNGLVIPSIQRSSPLKVESTFRRSDRSAEERARMGGKSELIKKIKEEKENINKENEEQKKEIVELEKKISLIECKKDDFFDEIVNSLNYVYKEIDVLTQEDTHSTRSLPPKKMPRPEISSCGTFYRVMNKEDKFFEIKNVIQACFLSNFILDDESIYKLQCIIVAALYNTIPMHSNERNKLAKNLCDIIKNFYSEKYLKTQLTQADKEITSLRERVESIRKCIRNAEIKNNQDYIIAIHGGTYKPRAVPKKPS